MVSVDLIIISPLWVEKSDLAPILPSSMLISPAFVESLVFISSVLLRMISPASFVTRPPKKELSKVI